VIKPINDSRHLFLGDKQPDLQSKEIIHEDDPDAH
jgi:hypothetical protein